MALVLAAGASLFLAAFYASSVAHDDETPWAGPSVRLEITIPQGPLKPPGKGVCSGVHIGAGYVLTAAHCAEGEVLVQDDREVTWATATERKWVSKDYDVALFQVDGLATEVKAARVDCRLPPIGEEIYIVGNPFGLPFMEAWGRVAAKPSYDVKPWNVLLPLDVTGGPGDSGGPVYDTRGHVVGIVVAGPRIPVPLRTFMYAVPSSAICSLIPPASDFIKGTLKQ